MQRLFSLMQSRWRVSRRENELWDVADFVLISEVCVIMHNLLIHMKEADAFAEDASRENSQFNAIAQLILRDNTRLLERGEEAVDASSAFHDYTSSAESSTVHTPGHFVMNRLHLVQLLRIYYD